MKAKEQNEDFNMKLMKILDRIENNLDKESAPANQEATGPLREKEDQGVIIDITVTPKGIPIGENTLYQVRPLSGSIIGGLGWMN
jgi:hypothetical protein